VFIIFCYNKSLGCVENLANVNLIKFIKQEYLLFSMTDLIAWISSGKGTVAHVQRVIEGEEWEKIYLLTNEEFKVDVPNGGNIEIVLVDNSKMLPEMIEDIKTALKDKVKMMETAVNIISGDGKEHMALMGALLKLGVGIRFVAFTKEGVKEI